MKISTITRLTTIAFVLIVILLALAVIWSLQKIDDAFQLKGAYQNYREQTDLQLSQPVSRYLLTGDATLLPKIEHNLQQLQKLTKTELPEEVQPDVINKLEHFSDTTLPALRAAGKLSNPEQLLIQNERELSGLLRSLQEYTNAAPGNQQPLQLRYEKQINQSLDTLLQLGHARQSYFQQPESALLENLTSQSGRLTEQLLSLQQLPRLGVYKTTTESDDLASLLGIESDAEEQSAREEQGNTLLDEIISLNNRLPKEMDNARVLTQQKIDTREQAQAAVADINQAITTVAAIITQRYQSTIHSIYYLLGGCLLLVLVICLGLNAVQQKLATILVTTSSFIHRLAKGHFSEQPDIQSNIAEISQLNASIGLLQDFFTRLLQDINTETQHLSQLRDSSLVEADKLENNAREQQLTSASTASQIIQLKASFQEVASRAAHTHTATGNVLELTQNGFQCISSTSDALHSLNREIGATGQSMDALQQDSIAIQNVLNIIQEFTEQTNLLALNAAIEAARAGESGRGFAVVADEVRNLAAKTTQSASEIQHIISSLAATTETAMQKMKQQENAAAETMQLAETAMQTIEEIRQAISEVNDMNTLIASSTEEQAAVTEQIAEAIELNLASTEQTTTAAETNKLHANQLASASEKLADLIKQLH